MAYAHNGQSAALPPAPRQTNLQTPASALRTAPPSSAPATQPPRPSSERLRSWVPPVPSWRLGAEESGTVNKGVEAGNATRVPVPSGLSDDVRAMLRAAIEEAVTPLRDRLDELEKTMLETIVRLSASSATTSVPLPPPLNRRRPVEAARPARSVPPPLPKKKVAAPAPITAPAPATGYELVDTDDDD
jgi:hypothetical protein